MRFNRENLAKNLPDTYAKNMDSNNYKILELERRMTDFLRASLGSVAGILNIDDASGETLDMYGERFGQLRGRATDAQYRIMIKAKITRSLCDGSNQGICNAICVTFGCDRSEVHITELAPCVIIVKEFPIDKINEAGFTASQATAIIRSLIPICMTLEPITAGGTFSFADDEFVYDENSGFGEFDSEIGGTLSTIYGADEETLLPI